MGFFSFFKRKKKKDNVDAASNNAEQSNAAADPVKKVEMAGLNYQSNAPNNAQDQQNEASLQREKAALNDAAKASESGGESASENTNANAEGETENSEGEANENAQSNEKAPSAEKDNTEGNALAVAVNEDAEAEPEAEMAPEEEDEEEEENEDEEDITQDDLEDMANEAAPENEAASTPENTPKNEDAAKAPKAELNFDNLSLKEMLVLYKRMNPESHMAMELKRRIDEKKGIIPEPPTTSKDELKLKAKNQNKKDKLYNSKEDKNLKSLKVVRDVFEGFKSGDEEAFLTAGDKKDQKMGVADVASTGKEVASTGKDIYDAAKEKFGWANDTVAPLVASSGGGGGKDIPLIGAIKAIISNIKGVIGGVAEKAIDFAMSDKLVTTVVSVVNKISAFVSAIPFLGSIIAVIKIIKDVYDMIKAQIRRTNMNDNRRIFKEKYLRKLFKDGDEAEPLALVKKVHYLNPRRFWKSTEFTVDNDNLKKRRLMLLKEREQPNLPKEVKSSYNTELRDIMQFELQDKMRKKNRNTQFEGVANILTQVGKIAADISAMGGGAVFGFIELGAEVVGHVKDVASTIGKVMDLNDKRKQKGKKYTNYLFEIIGALPSSYEEYDDKIAYAQVKETMEASGNADDALKMSKKLQGATNQNRDMLKSKTYNMFMKLFEG